MTRELLGNRTHWPVEDIFKIFIEWMAVESQRWWGKTKHFRYKHLNMPEAEIEHLTCKVGEELIQRALFKPVSEGPNTQKRAPALNYQSRLRRARIRGPLCEVGQLKAAVLSVTIRSGEGG